jgi:O-antigen/teichoic acid export membrane protein
MKLGLTFVGGVLISRSAVFIGSLYLSLADIASYGITKQVIDLLAGISGIWFFTYYPQLTKLRVENNIEEVRSIYIKSKLFFIFVFITGGISLLLLGNTILTFIGSRTHLVTSSVLTIALVSLFFENNCSIACTMLLSKNNVPFTKASLLTGTGTLLILWIFFKLNLIGLAVMFLAPGLAQLCCNYWKWPYEVVKELRIRISDYLIVMKSIFVGVKPLNNFFIKS